MKNFVHDRSSLALLSLAILASGCDTMLDMPKTTADMRQTTQQMAGTTETMSGRMEETLRQMKVTNSQMGEVKDAAHLQVLFGALAAMTDDKNTKKLVPVPFDMLPGAKKFAETAYEDELVDWFYIQYMNIVESTPDESQKVPVPVLAPKMDAAGNRTLELQYNVLKVSGKTYAVPATDWVFPESYIAEFNHKNDVTLSAMEAVASFIPQAMIEKIVELEIVNKGLREQTAYQILNLRDAFTRSALLTNSLYENKLKNLEQIREAVKLVKNIDYIANLPAPCLSQVGATEIKGYLSVSESYIYAQQASGLPALTSLQAIPLADSHSSYQSQTFAYDSTAKINNPGQGMFSVNEDGVTVTAVDQSAARLSAIKYNPKASQNDWKVLQRHFTNDLPKDIKVSAEAQNWLTQIKTYVH